MEYRPRLTCQRSGASSAITLSSALLALAFLVGKAKCSGPKTGKSNDPLTSRKEEIKMLMMSGPHDMEQFKNSGYKIGF